MSTEQEKCDLILAAFQAGQSATIIAKTFKATVSRATVFCTIKAFQEWDREEGPGLPAACEDGIHEEEDLGDQGEPLEVNPADGKGRGREQVQHDEAGHQGPGDGPLQEEKPATPVRGHQREGPRPWQENS